MRKFQLKVDGTLARVKKYKPWWKRDGYVDVLSLEVEEGRIVISANFNQHLIVLVLPEKCTFDQDVLVAYINLGKFFEVTDIGVEL